MIASGKGKAKFLCFRGRVPALKKVLSDTVLCFMLYVLCVSIL